MGGQLWVYGKASWRQAILLATAVIQTLDSFSLSRGYPVAPLPISRTLRSHSEAVIPRLARVFAQPPILGCRDVIQLSSLAFGMKGAQPSKPTLIRLVP